MSYTTLAGQSVITLSGANFGQRTVPGDVRYFVMHLTEGSDSRQYLVNNPPGVSTHYLTGEYPDTNGPQIYKYCSETNDAAYTQGFSLLGSLGTYDHRGFANTGFPTPFQTYRNLNDVAISYEIEGTVQQPPSARLLAHVVTHVAEIISYWHQPVNGGLSLVLIRHLDVDSEKSDPQGVNWTAFLKAIYQQVTV